MKRILVAVMTALLLSGGIQVNAQLTKEQIKERKEIYKASKDELNRKASKAARKEAKKLSKAGWQCAPGALPLEKQLDRSYMMQMEFDGEMFPKYIMAEAMSIGENYDAAKLQAIELAKQNLAGQIQTEVTALIENSVTNRQLSAEQAATISETVVASKSRIIQSLGRVIPVVEVYRSVPSNRNKEVLVRLAYNSDMAKSTVKAILYEKLENKADNLHNQLDSIFDANAKIK